MKLIIDSNNLAYRIMTSTPFLSKEDGDGVTVIYGFISSLRHCINKLRPSSVIAIWDGKPTSRREIYPAYKSNRNKHRSEEEIHRYEDYLRQNIYLRKVLEVFGINQIYEKTSEADDLISIICKNHPEEEKVIMSEDRDFVQLIDLKTSLYCPIRKYHWGVKDIQERFGLEPSQMLHKKVLMGDQSDNISGVAGIGEVISTKLLQAHGYINNILNNPSLRNKSKKYQTIFDSEDIIQRNFKLMDLSLSKDYVNNEVIMSRAKFSKEGVKKVLSDNEFFSFLAKGNWFIEPFSSLEKETYLKPL